jgi:hypothetical protein
MADLEFRVLGPLEVLRDGESMVLPPGLPRALLGRLLGSVNTVVATGQLIEDLCRHHPPSVPARRCGCTSRTSAVSSSPIGLPVLRRPSSSPDRPATPWQRRPDRSMRAGSSSWWAMVDAPSTRGPGDRSIDVVRHGTRPVAGPRTR